jgi:IS5 family transposase
MGMKQARSYTFADAALADRSVGSLDVISQSIDWQLIASVIDVHYSVGKAFVGRPSHSGLVLFKMLLLGMWYDLSDRKLEAAVADRISFLRFVGLGLDDEVPDHSRLCRFRKALAHSPGGMAALLQAVNQQLEAKKLLVTKGILVDATITDSARRHVKVGGAGDAEADFAGRKNPRQSRFGYKAHTATDARGLVLGMVTTPANRHENAQLGAVLALTPTPAGATVYADKGYPSDKNNKLLASRGLQNGIMDKAYRNKPLTKEQIDRNREIVKHRYPVERTFGGMKQWFRRGRHRYVGLVKAHFSHLLMGIGYNLWRLPGLLAH